jgi:hypothetical protein
MSSENALFFKQPTVLDLKTPAASVLVKPIPQGRYATIPDVCRAAETTARGCIPTGIIYGGAGSGSHWPFFKSVLSDDTLALISSGLLSSHKAEELRADLGESDNSSFLPSPKESKVAKALGRPQPPSAAAEEGGANLKTLFEEAAVGGDTESGGGAQITPPHHAQTRTATTGTLGEASHFPDAYHKQTSCGLDYR